MKKLMEMYKNSIIQLYHKKGIIPVKGRGVYLKARNGKRYLDLIGGIGVNLLGYNHLPLRRYLHKQMTNFFHVSNYFLNPKEINVAEMLINYYGQSAKVGFSNSGTESTEFALKIVFKYMKQTGKKYVISFDKSFHGRTTGALSITGLNLGQENFCYNRNFVKILPYNDIDALTKNINDEIAAIFIEPIIGGGGVVKSSCKFMEKLHTLSRKHSIILIADEIQSGMGRTGKFFAYQHCNKVIPDIITMAKGLGGGLPLGAIIVSNKFSDIIQYGEHGSTFAPNPVALAGAFFTLKYIKQHDLLAKNRANGEYLMQNLQKLQLQYPNTIRDIRGKGLMIGIEFSEIAGKLAEKFFLSNGILVNMLGEKIMRLLPPYIIQKKDMDLFLRVMKIFVAGVKNEQ